MRHVLALALVVELACDAGPRLAEPAEATTGGRRGVIRLQGHGLVDDDGEYLGIGLSLFWAPWGYLHDRVRLEENLACAAGQRLGCERGVDFIRVFGIVGPGGGWEDRTITASDVLKTDVVAGLTDLAYNRYGLRVQWTIFAGVESAPTRDSRATVVRHVAAQLAPRAAKVQLIEVANEGWKNGFPGEDGRAELFTLSDLLAERVPNLRALTAPADGRSDFIRGSSATLLTVHTDRTTTGSGGRLRPVRQASEWAESPYAWQNNEPVGIGSSVATEDDPRRLTLAAIQTWLCRGAAYVIHTGAGIRGGGRGDLKRGRAANLWEQPTLAPTVAALRRARVTLPPDLPNFEWFSGMDSRPGYPFETKIDDGSGSRVAREADVYRAFAAIAPDSRMIAAPIGIARAVPFTAVRRLSFDVIDPLSWVVREHVELQPGESYTVPTSQGWVFAGTAR